MYYRFQSSDKDSFYFPTFQNYTEKTFDGDFETYADYKDRYIKTNIDFPFFN